MRKKRVKTSALATIGHRLAILHHRFYADHCPSRAASLAYATLLSLVPFAMVSVYVLSWFPWFKGVEPALQQFILTNFVADSATVIAQYFHNFIGHLQRLSLFSIAWLAVITLLMIYNMVSAFNEIWKVRMKAHFAVAFGIYLLVLIFTPLLFAIILIILSYLASLPLIAKLTQTPLLNQPLLILLPRLSEWVIFTLFNWILPSTRVRFLHAMVAGLITTILFELAKQGFALYIYYIPTYRLIYGALATIPVFLVWLYVSWLVILIGAEICHWLAQNTK